MNDLFSLLKHGFRRLDPEGRLTQDPAELGDLNGAASLYVVDLEMSGPNAQMHEVLDLAGVRATLTAKFPEEASWGSRVKPKHIGNAVPGALKVVGYSSKEWKSAIDLEEALDKFSEAGRGAIIAGWGIGQDMAFLVETYQRMNQPWPFATVAFDVQPVARILLKDGGQVDRFNLGHVADRLGIGRMGEHGALADAYATYDVLVKLMELPASKA